MERSTLHRMLELKSITFGFTVFYFIWTAAAWLRVPGADYHSGPDSYVEMFVAAGLFVAAAGLVLDRAWSKLLAVILSAHLPVFLLFIFWMLAERGDVTPFSPAHISRWFTELARMPAVVWLWLALSSIIFACAVPTLVRAKADHKAALMPVDHSALPPCAQTAQEQLRRFTTRATSAALRDLHHADVNRRPRATLTSG